METIGWIGSVLLALCGLPQLIKCIKIGSAEGLSITFLALWLGGEVCYVIATLTKFGFISWMLFNYTFNIFCILGLLYYYFWPRQSNENI